MEPNDPKVVIEQLNKAFLEFKAENAKGREADKAVLAKAEAEIARLDALNNKQAADAEAKAKQIDEIEKRLNRAALGAPGAAPGSERKEAFERWMRGGARGLDLAPEALRGLVEKKSLISSDDAAGGYLSPPEYVTDIIKAEVLASPVRTLVGVRQTGRGSVLLPKRTTPAAAGWVSEIGTRAETTNPAFGMVEIQTHEMTAETYVSFMELEDSVFDIEAFLAGEFGEQFGVTEGAAVVAGNGVGKPWGFTDAAAPVIAGGYVTNSGSASAITADGMLTLAHAVKSAYAARGKWALNRATLGALRKLKDSQNRYLWEPSLQFGVPSQILGSPFVELPDMPDVGTNAYPVAFGDFARAYTLADRLNVAIVRDPYTKASVGQVRFVARRRIGGQVVLAEAIRLMKCAT